MNEVVIKVIGNYSYQTSRCLGEGVYGKVYEGMERETKEKVAIKKIDLNTFTNDKYLENAIFSEIYLLKRFNHPNIVRFKDVLSSKNSLYIITEFCKNGDLKELIKRKKFKQDQAFQIMRQLLSGFSELVREKIIHRDLKPANILINQGVYKIGDFGFAKYVDNFGSQMLKSCVGSPIYMAPQILERTQYTTKCDIWSLGIIFYEMIHGYPPWKARDETELLRSIKNIPIVQLLKKSNLSQRGADFLKKTLAFSEQERIGWTELFETFSSKSEESDLNTSGKQKQRTSSSNQHSGSSSNQEYQWKGQSKPTNTHLSLTNMGGINSSPVINTNAITSAYAPTNSNLSVTPQRNKSSYFSSNSNSQLNITEKAGSNESHFGVPASVANVKRGIQVENVVQTRQYLVYYHFYCIQLLANFSTVQTMIGRTEFYSKLLLGLATIVKSRSTYCLSMIVMQSKINKNVDDLYKRMQTQHEAYEMAYTDIVAILERTGQYKNIKNEYISAVGQNQIISQQRLQKMETFMVGAATENAQVLSEEVKKRLKVITSRDYPLVEILDYVLDVLRLALGKSKSIKQMQQDEKDEDEDIKDFVARVFGKVDRLATNF